MYSFKMQTWQKKNILTTSESKSAAECFVALTALEVAGPAGLIPAESGDNNAFGTP